MNSPAARLAMTRTRSVTRDWTSSKQPRATKFPCAFTRPISNSSSDNVVKQRRGSKWRHDHKSKSLGLFQIPHRTTWSNKEEARNGDTITSQNPSAYFKFLIGQRGQTKKRLEM